jgi:hypothetical protein
MLYLSEHPCLDCGTTDHRVLEFDHVRGKKEFGVGQMVRMGHQWDRIAREIDKCEVRCVNCHRIKTGERGNWWWKRT